MNNAKRIEIEQRIVRKYLKAVKAAGWKVVAVSDYYGEPLDGLKDLFACDDARVVVERNHKRSFLLFVYGNEPGEVLSDYGMSLHEDIAAVNQYAEQWA